MEFSILRIYHAIVQLVDQILESLEYNTHSHYVFVNLPKAFDIVYYSAFLKKIAIIWCN